MKEEVLKKKLEQASIPSNCAFLLPKKVNVEIWKLLSSYNRTIVVRMQEVQNLLSASNSMILKSSSFLVDFKNGKKDDTREPLAN